jgi:hypothetical protein
MAGFFFYQTERTEQSSDKALADLAANRARGGADELVAGGGLAPTAGRLPSGGGGARFALRLPLLLGGLPLCLLLRELFFFLATAAPAPRRRRCVDGGEYAGFSGFVSFDMR